MVTNVKLHVPCSMFELRDNVNDRTHCVLKNLAQETDLRQRIS